jgi:hypothetical protein
MVADPAGGSAPVAGARRYRRGCRCIRLGAKVRWRDIEDDPRLAVAHPRLRAAVAHVAHYQIRNRGTMGGSLAHADPAAELPGIAVTCGAEIEIIGEAGRRTLLAKEFFSGPLMTELRSDEIITELRLPPWPAARRWGFEEFAPRPLPAFRHNDGVGTPLPRKLLRGCWGGRVETLAAPLAYGKPGFKNDGFLAWGRKS